MDLSQLNQYSAQIAGILAALVALYRFVVSPLLRIVKRTRNTSEDLAKALPILLELSKTFSTNDGKLTLPGEIKELQQLSKINADLLRALGNKLNLCWFRSDANGNCVYASNKLLELMGITLEQSLGSGWKNSICSKFRDKVIEDWDMAIKEKREFDLEYAYCQGLSHKEIQIHCHGYKIELGGEIIGYIGIVTPINESSVGYGL